MPVVLEEDHRHIKEPDSKEKDIKSENIHKQADTSETINIEKPEKKARSEKDQNKVEETPNSEEKTNKTQQDSNSEKAKKKQAVVGKRKTVKKKAASKS